MGECGLSCGEKEGGTGIQNGGGRNRWVGGGAKGMGKLGSRVKSQGMGAIEWMGCDVTSHKVKGTHIMKWNIVMCYFLS